jgi:hypothetical protein
MREFRADYVRKLARLRCGGSWLRDSTGTGPELSPGRR